MQPPNKGHTQFIATQVVLDLRKWGHCHHQRVLRLLQLQLVQLWRKSMSQKQARRTGKKIQQSTARSVSFAAFRRAWPRHSHQGGYTPIRYPVNPGMDSLHMLSSWLSSLRQLDLDLLIKFGILHIFIFQHSPPWQPGTAGSDVSIIGRHAQGVGLGYVSFRYQEVV